MKEMNVLYNYILECNDKMVNRYTDWLSVVMGFEAFDNQFEINVNKLLEDRELHINTDEIKSSIVILRNDQYFEECLRRKLIECSSDPKSFFDHITSNVSWNSNDSCISCPDKSCVLYVCF